MVKAEGEIRYSNLGITQEHFVKAYEHTGLFSDSKESLVIYTRGTMRRFQKEQPLLFEQIGDYKARARIFDSFSFDLASALTYDMLPESQRHIPLCEEDIASSYQTLEEHRRVDKYIPDIRWYIEKLRYDTPEFAAWIMDSIATLHADKKTISDFLLATTLTSLPFYMRSEAEELERKFFHK